MNSIIICTPHLHSEATQDLLRRKVGDWLNALPFAWEVAILNPYLGVECDELAYVGLDPRQMELSHGPITVAALGFDPPERSTHFHVTPLTLAEGLLAKPRYQWPQSTLHAAFAACKVLDTKRLTLLPGPAEDAAMVLEDGSDAMALATPSDSIGKPPGDAMPDGDDAPIIRRFLDDSANILMEQPFNHERIEEGLEPLAILWPWGCGFRPQLPNLSLKRGQPAQFCSSRLRLAGVARLCSYRHEPWHVQATGTRVAWEKCAAWASRHERAVLIVDSWSEFSHANQEEEAHWLLNEMVDRFLSQIDQRLAEKSATLTWLAPKGESSGIALHIDPHNAGSPILPFDGRILDDPRAKRVDYHSVIETMLQRACGDPW